MPLMREPILGDQALMTAGARVATARWESYASRYRAAEWRAVVFADMVLDDLRRIDRPSTVVDIGCGSGFDGALDLQAKIAAHCSSYIGVEPDHQARTAPHFTAVHRCLFEQTPIESASVDLAFGVMVVEHVADPVTFMAKLADVLRDGGVFWAFTVDRRHWSTWSSLVLERLRLKTAYLNILHGKRGEERYANYPVHYRLNSPRSLSKHTDDFVFVDILNLARVGAEDYSLPRLVRPLNHAVDHLLNWIGAPGSNLAFRLVRAPRKRLDPESAG
jgi:SAM-dependent methyltransferase